MFTLDIIKEHTSNNFKCPDCNVLFITMDALRADHIGAYGYYRNTSPNIDKLANKGILFKNFIANGPHTYLSLPSMISSKYPIFKKETSKT